MTNTTMDKKLTLQEVKTRELKILDYFVSICEKYHLTYYLTDGTLLGAIRHKGFIPWDDDIDVSMSRVDYEKFLDVCKNEKSVDFMVLTPEPENYPYNFIKIVDLGTRLIEEEMMDIPNMGIWIDVLPLDGIKVPNGLHVKILKYLNLARAAASYKVCPQKRKGMYWQWKICRIIGLKTLQRLYTKISRRYEFGKVPYVGWTQIAFRALYPKHVFEKTTKVTFEGKEYNAPLGYDEYLRIQYKNYMELPPEEKRTAHFVQAVYK